MASYISHIGVAFLCSLSYFQTEAILYAEGCKMADGNWYRVGATRVLGCTRCTCEARDYVYCVDLCPDCEYNYRRYPIGESFQDGCKVCMCQGRGKVVCSEEECPYHRSKMFQTFGLS
uniref:VWFC domain-containing protein n=2 Tax=Magallana gigas TaxID=29159 RepID=A0A8W8M716_MAGGI|nr:uncharacterized protein LOC105339521 isoform X1 [Crassostrea gigas]